MSSTSLVALAISFGYNRMFRRAFEPNISQRQRLSELQKPVIWNIVRSLSAHYAYDKKARLEFAIAHLVWSVQKWKTVLFSDKSKFNSDGIKLKRKSYFVVMPDQIFEKLFMANFICSQSFARNLLRGNRRRNIFIFSF